MDQTIELNELILKIKNDPLKMDVFIHEQLHVIVSMIEYFTEIFIRDGMVELEISIEAFRDAIIHYELEMGEFFDMAQNAIKTKLLQHYKENNYPLFLAIIQKNDHQDWLKEHIKEYRKEEILRLKEELKQWGIHTIDLAHSAPGKEEDYLLYWQAILFIISDREIQEDMTKNKFISMAKVIQFAKLTPKMIEEGRSYILTMALIFTGKYHFIQKFIKIPSAKEVRE